MFKLSILSPTLSSHEIMIEHYLRFKKYSQSEIELIIIDQGLLVDDKLHSISESDPNFIYVHSTRKGLSYNRNLGLKYARGEFIIFFDDDTYFYNNSYNILRRYLDIKGIDFYSLCVVDDNGLNTSYTSGEYEETITLKNIESKVNSNGLVISSQAIANYNFDELMGVGSIYGACEEVDLVVNLIEDKYYGVYLPGCKVVHPPKPFDNIKSYNYGLGHGYFTYKLIFVYSSFDSILLGLSKVLKSSLKFILGVLYKKKYSNYLHSAIGYFTSFKLILIKE